MITKPLNNDYLKIIQNNIETIKENVKLTSQKINKDPSKIKIMAVTKYVKPQYVNYATKCGISLLGENRAQDLISKYDEYTLKSNNIHFIGHLQTNKIKYILDKVSMIESVDSLDLALKIEDKLKKINKNMDILLQVNISDEITKSGFSVNSLKSSLEALNKLENIKIKGLMCIPKKEESFKYFEKMQKIFLDIEQLKLDNINMHYLSMGMSHDYNIAIEYGANIIRIGRAIFNDKV